MKKLLLLLCVTLLFCTSTTSIQAAGEGNSVNGAENSKLTAANMEFSFNIFKKLNAGDKSRNVFISPYSISTALTMAYNGAGSTTKKAMEKALGFAGMSSAEVNKGFKYLRSALQQNDKKVELDIGNSIWIRSNKTIKQNFINLNKDTFGAKVTKLDFSQKSAAGTINKWVSDATRGKVKEIVKSPIPSDMMMYLINAVYFKGEWTKKFDINKTNDGNFISGSGKTKEVRMMNMKDNVEYGSGKDYKAVRLPYGQGSMAMYCVLPENGSDINTFINTLNSKKWTEIKSSISKRNNVVLAIPKFKIQYGAKELKESLSSLGMKEAFSAKTADFSGMGSNLGINSVLHKAVIEVNEEGSEAAAVTAVIVGTTAFEEPLSFIADRPFFFVIADDRTNTLLFIGKAYDL